MDERFDAAHQVLKLVAQVAHLAANGGLKILMALVKLSYSYTHSSELLLVMVDLFSLSTNGSMHRIRVG